ncbi:hypothetical protein [Actinacidiphila sp. bgisy160]|uniref:hypothetical protein n=1 Tax=Actinacidiphila sp. bgisy160 TaxID=3413796 RepID=UPI003D759611
MRTRRYGTGAALLCLAAVLVAGCDDGPKKDAAPPRPSPTASVPAKVSAAEEVKARLEERLAVGEQRFGTGVNSPCATSSARMFTADCQEAADATAAAADLALAEIDGRDGFATLGSVARKIRTAADTYGRLGCAQGPAAADARKACLEPAAVIAQGFPDLRVGANLALAGR